MVACGTPSIHIDSRVFWCQTKYLAQCIISSAIWNSSLTTQSSTNMHTSCGMWRPCLVPLKSQACRHYRLQLHYRLLNTTFLTIQLQTYCPSRMDACIPDTKGARLTHDFLSESGFDGSNFFHIEILNEWSMQYFGNGEPTVLSDWQKIIHKKWNFRQI